MQQSDLITLLKTFSKTEMKRAEQFLKSPYHSGSETALELFQYIRRYYPELENPRLHRKHAYAKLYPGEKLNERRLQNQMSKLKKLMEEFVMLEQLREDEGAQERLLINALYERLPYQDFAESIKKRMSKLEEGTIRDSAFFQEMLWLREELYYHPDQSKYEVEANTLPDMLQDLDQFYTLVKYRYITDMNVRKEVLNEITQNHRPSGPDLEKLKQRNALILLYHQLYKLQKGALSVDDLSVAITAFPMLLPTVAEKEKSFLLSCFINSTATHHNKGHEGYAELLLKLYKMADAENLILYRGKMQASTFLNIVSFGSGQGELDWVTKFIDKYRRYLPPEEQKDILNLGWGYWYFHYSKSNQPKNYYLNKAHEYLSQIPYSDLGIDLRLRSLQLRVFFELELLSGNEAVFFDFSYAFERWLQRNDTLSKERTNAYIQYIRYARKLGKIYQKGNIDRKKLARLKREIQANTEVVSKKWLLEQVEGFEQSLQ